ncbi:hypothetical protein VCSRO56_3646 [Vibrio cholerae]|nr:hypothetical protein VCSRO56_3646 [Vibrio cholerae]HDV5583364.1 hypothetical protein [Vibrio cholerae]
MSDDKLIDTIRNIKTSTVLRAVGFVWRLIVLLLLLFIVVALVITVFEERIYGLEEFLICMFWFFVAMTCVFELKSKIVSRSLIRLLKQ